MRTHSSRFPLAELIVASIALAIGIYGQLPAFTNPYVLVDDFRQHLYWMRQFRDSALFQDDLLTEYAKHYQPWGFIFLYYVLSPIADPLVISKVLPLALFVLSSFYLFKLVRHIAGGYAGFLASLIFMTTFTYLDRISGGLPRSFGFPLLIIFLYYLTKKEYLKSSLLLVLQCLFYPTLFFISALTYLFMWIKVRHRKIRLDHSFPKAIFFILGVLLGASLLYGKHLLTPHSLIGNLVTREQMVNHPEYYESGRYPVFPTAPLPQEIGRNIRRGLFTSRLLRKNPVVDTLRAAKLRNVISIVLVLFFFFVLGRMKLYFPQELFALFLASVAMYQISDLFLLKLFIPRRYLEYSIPLLSLIAFAMMVGGGIGKIKRVRLRRSLQIAGIVLVALLNFDIDAKAMFVDLSSYADLYRYLGTLSRETVIAAPPELADGIPTFSRRKVFIQYELSHPFFDRYWEVVKKRTSDFFDAYYSKNLSSLYQFCQENKIEYLVVDKKHFTEEYLTSGKIYFEPFNTSLKKMIGKRRDFALSRIPEKDKLFAKGDLFVIPKESLKSKQ